MKVKKLTQRQIEIIGYILGFQEKYKDNPRLIDIAVCYGITKQAVSLTCQALKKKGFISFNGRLSNHNKGDSLIVTDSGHEIYEEHKDNIDALPTT
jgi:DNA-binding MarR family transcriptional regulator